MGPNKGGTIKALVFAWDFADRMQEYPHNLAKVAFRDYSTRSNMLSATFEIRLLDSPLFL